MLSAVGTSCFGLLDLNVAAAVDVAADVAVAVVGDGYVVAEVENGVADVVAGAVAVAAVRRFGLSSPSNLP